MRGDDREREVAAGVVRIVLDHLRGGADGKFHLHPLPPLGLLQQALLVCEVSRRAMHDRPRTRARAFSALYAQRHRKAQPRAAPPDSVVVAAESALDTAERIGRCIAGHPLDLGHSEVRIEASVSVATIMPGDTVEEVLRRAARNRERVKEF